MMKDEVYDFVIAGMGAGGATLARELTLKGKKVLGIESGHMEKKVGTFIDSLRYYDLPKPIKMPPRTKSGVIIWRAGMLGGTTVVSAGNGVRCLEKELADLGIHLEDEFEEAEREMNILPQSLKYLTRSSKRLREVSKDLGYELEAMPKFIDPKKCRRCGLCMYGCPYGAKWSALEYLEEAREKGLKILTATRVNKVNIEGGRARSVTVRSKKRRYEIFGKQFILASGGMASAPILQRSGIEDAGSRLFLDLLINTYGLTEKAGKTKEPSMALVYTGSYEREGFILSTVTPMHRMIRYAEMGVPGALMPNKGFIGIMTKIRDDSVGGIDKKGILSKTLTAKDREKLEKGIKISKEILIGSGISPGSIRQTYVEGAHPGGTAAIGRIVDSNLQTKVRNLYVCDSSVLPVSPGKPPILTIVALAKRLSKIIA